MVYGDLIIDDEFQDLLPAPPDQELNRVDVVPSSAARMAVKTARKPQKNKEISIVHFEP